MSEVTTPAATVTPGMCERSGTLAYRREIRALIRHARQSKRLTQAQLGAAVGVSRFTIHRVEMGALDVNGNLADRLSDVLELPDLALLLAQQASFESATENTRDLVVGRLFNTSNLETVTIAVTDDLDVYEAIYNSRDDTPLLDARGIHVVFPTIERERELFHGQPIYEHIEYQIKRLADLQESDDRRLNNLRVFESDSILTSAVIARTRTGTECAFWTPLSQAGQVQVGGTLPVATSTDPLTTGRLEAYAESLICDTNQIRTNEALCKVVRVDEDSGQTDSQFTRYFEVGTDQEEDVAENEGFAVVLVLVVALCPRKQFGVARRVITYKRPSARHDRERLSLFSNNVDDSDIRAARTAEGGTSPDMTRSRRGALAAALDINEYMNSKRGEIPDLAFQVAASREFRMFELDVAPDRFCRVDLPPELKLIKKQYSGGLHRAAVAPKLFVLELDAVGAHPEVDTLRANADIEEIGASDMSTEDARLNDFLRKARECGFLMPLLEKLEVADR